MLTVFFTGRYAEAVIEMPFMKNGVTTDFF